jgi:hypothetical protein
LNVQREFSIGIKGCYEVIFGAFSLVRDKHAGSDHCASGQHKKGYWEEGPVGKHHGWQGGFVYSLVGLYFLYYAWRDLHAKERWKRCNIFLYDGKNME